MEVMNEAVSHCEERDSKTNNLMFICSFSTRRESYHLNKRVIYICCIGNYRNSRQLMSKQGSNSELFSHGNDALTTRPQHLRQTCTQLDKTYKNLQLLGSYPFISSSDLCSTNLVKPHIVVNFFLLFRC